jgi:hypothetical protein
MNKFSIEYQFNAGEPVWFMHDNSISKGIIDRVQIRYETTGLSSRGYKVKEFFNKLIPIPRKDQKLDGCVEYSVDLLYADSENFKSCPHYFKDYENKLFKSKAELAKSLSN